MASRTIVVATEQTPFPAGTTSGGVKLSISGFPDTVLQDPYTFTADFGVGDYTVTAQAVDADGLDLGAPVSTSFSVVADPLPDVMVNMPITLTIS